MKQFVNVIEVAGEGFEALLGKAVLIFAMNYIYAGTLTGVNDSFIQLKDAQIVYETGPFTQAGYKDAQKLPGEFYYVQRSAIESFGVGK